MIVGKAVGCVIATPETFIIEDEHGNEYPAVTVEDTVVFTATENDIRKGKVAATEKGVTEGDKVIPAYHTHQGVKVVTPGSSLQLLLKNDDTYDYTKLQAIICDFNSNLNDSVSAQGVAIDNNVYEVLSVDSISQLTKNELEKTVDFNLINQTDKPIIIRYFTYREV